MKKMTSKNLPLKNEEILHKLPVLEKSIPLSKKYPWKWIIISFIIIFFLYWVVGLPDQLEYNTTSIFGIQIPLLIVQVYDQLILLRIQILIVISFLILFMVILPKFKYLAFLKQKTLSLGLGLLSLFIIIAIFAPFIAPYGFDERHDDCPDKILCRQAPPSPNHIMGTTTLGFDLYSRVIYGSIIPFQMSLMAAFLALVIGVPLGLVSAYYGGTADRLINSLMDMLYSFPSILLAITLSLFLTEIPFLGDEQSLRIIVVVGFSVGVVYIPTFYKVVRGNVFQIKELAYIEAPRSIGASNSFIQRRYILPNVISTPLALIPFPMVDAILTAAALAFLGIGIQPPTPDWGYDLTNGSKLITVSPWWITFPGLMIFLLAFAFALLGDALNDRFNPSLNEALFLE